MAAALASRVFEVQHLAATLAFEQLHPVSTPFQALSSCAWKKCGADGDCSAPPGSQPRLLRGA
jgi:hypothetical protein